MLIFSFSFSKSAQSQLLSWSLNSTLMRPRRAAPIRLELLLGISRGGPRDRFFTDLYRKKNGWETLTLVKISGGRSMTLFCLPFHAGSSASLDSWRTEDSQEETEPNIVRNVTHKSSATWGRCVACGAGHETVLYCAINTDEPRMTMDVLRWT